MITIHVNPIPKPRMTQRDKWLKPARPSVARYRAFKTEVLLQAKRQMKTYRMPYSEMPHSLRLDFHIECPASWSKNKIFVMSGSFHQQKPDLDNLIKAILDIFFEDDSVVYQINAAKFWTRPGDGAILISEESHLTK